MLIRQIKRLKGIILRGFVFILILNLSCCAANKPRKLPKRGPIPCPVKDC